MSIVTPLAVKAARDMLLDDYYKVIAFGSGPCKKCKECGLKGCSFPAQTVPAMEACGLDVFYAVRANEIEIHTLRDKTEEQNYFGMLLVK